MFSYADICLKTSLNERSDCIDSFLKHILCFVVRNIVSVLPRSTFEFNAAEPAADCTTISSYICAIATIILVHKAIDNESHPTQDQ